MSGLTVVVNPSLSYLGQISQSALRRIHRLRTVLLRAIGQSRTEEERLRRRVFNRVKELGQWYEDGNSDLVAFTYHPILFPGFERIKCHRAEVELRLKAILTRLDIAEGDWILDVGANVGYFSFSLERLGAMVEAYEANSATFEIGAALSKLNKSNVLYINKALGLNSLKYLRKHYRAILLLSVFHWIVKQEGRNGAAAILRDLAQRADMIFFEVPTSPGDGMFKDELFASNAAIDEFLHETLPGLPSHELVCDNGWGRRLLFCIDCKGAHFGT